MGNVSLFKQLACLFVSWSLVVTPVYAATDTSAPAPKPKTADPAKLQRNLNGYFATLKAVRADIDRSSFDLDALLDKLDHDEKNIIRFVQQEIAVELYPGVLRGAKGTLMSRSGNALDQSLLLATLLKNAGADARILRGELNDEWAKKLVDSLRPVKPAEMSAGEREKIQNRFVAFAKTATGKDMSWNELQGLKGPLVPLQSTDLFKSATKSTQFLNEQLKKGNISLENASVPAEAGLIKEARDYFWVEYRQGPADAWLAVHPAFDAAAGSKLQVKARETFKDAIPESLQQTLELSVAIQQRVQGKITEKPVMAAWKRPVSNFYGEPLTFANMPISAPAPTDPAKVGDWFKSATTFVPVLNQSVLPGAVAFDMSGQTVAPEDAASPYAGVVKTVGDKANKAASALADIGSVSATNGKPVASRAMELEGQTLGLKLSAPGRPSVSYSRTIANRSDGFAATGHVTRPKRAFDDTDMALSLASQYTIMLGSGSLPEAYHLDKMIERILGLQSVILQIDNPELASLILKNKNMPVDWPGFLPLLVLFDSFPLADNVMSFRFQPSIALHNRRFDVDGGFFERVDIVRNARVVFERQPSGLRSLPIFNLALGVWDTYIERHSVANVGATRSFSAIDELNKEINTGQRFALIRDPQALSALASKLPSVALRAIKKDLIDGYMVLLPVAASAKLGESVAWWRVNDGTGEALGMGGDGRGTVMTEKVEIDVSMLVAAGALAGILGGACVIGVDRQGKSDRIECVSGAIALGLGIYAGNPAVISTALALLARVVEY